MPLIIPPAVNYPSPIQSLPSVSQDQPREGRRQIACEVLWGSMGGASKCVAFDLDGQRERTFSQVSTLKVDNSASGADVQFIFPDTFEIITIPAGSPLLVVPVYSNSKTFFAVSLLASPEDVTRFIALNYYTSPADVPTSEATNTPVSTNAVWAAPGPVATNLIAAGINGTLVDIQVATSFLTSFGGVNSFGQFQVRDGAGTVFVPSWKLGISSAASPAPGSYVQMNLQDVNLRFRNGLIVEFSLVGAGPWPGSVNANMVATYKQP